MPHTHTHTHTIYQRRQAGSLLPGIFIAFGQNDRHVEPGVYVVVGLTSLLVSKMKGWGWSGEGCSWLFLFSCLVTLCPWHNTGELLVGLISLTLPHIHLFLTLVIIPVPITSFLYLSAAASVMWKQFSQQLKI